MKKKKLQDYKADEKKEKKKSQAFLSQAQAWPVETRRNLAVVMAAAERQQ